MPAVKYVLVCDDVRNELGNKQSAIGIYTGGITITLPPPQVGPPVSLERVFVLFVFEGMSGIAQISWQLTISAPSGEAVVEMPRRVLDRDPAPPGFSTGVKIAPLRLPEIGTYKIRLRWGTGDDERTFEDDLPVFIRPGPPGPRV